LGKRRPDLAPNVSVDQLHGLFFDADRLPGRSDQRSFAEPVVEEVADD
jgi:hypothetical protein